MVFCIESRKKTKGRTEISVRPAFLLCKNSFSLLIILFVRE